ncbi:SGNH/GDSL hydrolase family protein [Pseudomonas sp.]|uniref:SGNH/GDSL hydrolase family protein n=1 Tax=Pseudomonas sp. TaxID=306 RepID=UPI0028985F75|nr:SGNH/GDSL hydrolase family protein [Pseudomonas sp.]
MPITKLTPLPATPSRNDAPDNFVQKADKYLAAQNKMVDQFNQAIDGINGFAEPLTTDQGAGAVGYLAPVDGASARPVADKLSESISVKDISGTVTRTAIAKAATVTTDVVVPEGVYDIAGAPISVRDTGRFRVAPGTLIFRSDGGTADIAHAQVLPGFLSADAYYTRDRMSAFKINPQIVAFGDSNTAWVDATSTRIGTGEGSWPAYLEMMLKDHIYYCEARVRGDGHPGETAAYGVSVLDTYLSTFAPQIIAIAWGTNDIVKGRTRKAYLADMRTIIEYWITRGVFPIVLGIPWVGDADRLKKTHAWNSSLKELCDTFQIPFIFPVQLFGGAPATYFASDQVHYTDSANQLIAGLMRDAIISNYGLPRDKFNTFKVSRGDPLDTWSWELPGLYHTYGKDLLIKQTPNQYVRRFYPYCLEIPAGQEVQFKADGPLACLIDRASTQAAGGTLTLNGTDDTLLGRTAVLLKGSVSARLDGSSNTFRIGAKAGGGSVFLVGVNVWHGQAHDYRTASVASIRNGVFVPNKVITITNGTIRLQTVMQPIASGSTVKVGLSPTTGIQNVGTTTARTALTAGLLHGGFMYFDTDTQSFWRWNSATSAWVAA